jgi:hypothetical protein
MRSPGGDKHAAFLEVESAQKAVFSLLGSDCRVTLSFYSANTSRRMIRWLVSDERQKVECGHGGTLSCRALDGPALECLLASDMVTLQQSGRLTPAPASAEGAP